MANASYNTVTVADTATQILAANARRKGCLIRNNSSQTVYLGFDSSVTTSNGLPLGANETLMNSGQFEAYRGAIYGIVASSTSDVRYWDFGQ